MRLLRIAVVAVVVITTVLPITPAVAALRIEATTPDLADITQRITGDLAQVSSLTTGTEDQHAVPLKPTFVTRLAKADALILNGMRLEHSYLPGLLQGASNSKIQPGSAGYIDASRYIKPTDVPQVVDMSLGDLHPQGNPHYNVDPRNGPLMARAIYEGLVETFPEHRATFDANFKSTADELIAAARRLRPVGEAMRGAPIVTMHKTYEYLGQTFGIDFSMQMEPVPGVPPTPGHLAKVARDMKASGIKLIALEAQFNPRSADFLARESGATIVRVPINAGAFPGCDTYVGFVETLLGTLADGVAAAYPDRAEAIAQAKHEAGI